MPSIARRAESNCVRDHARRAVLRCPSASGRRRSGALFGARACALDRRLGCGRRHPQHRLPSAVQPALRPGRWPTYFLRPSNKTCGALDQHLIGPGCVDTAIQVNRRVG